MAWVIDPSHTRANFSVRHLMIANVRGQFDKVSGNVDFNEADPTKSSIDVKIDTASLDTKDTQRDGHLKSPDFLDISNYPYIEFKSKRTQKVDDNTAKVIGDLTIRDITREVTLDVDYNGQGKTPWGTTNAGFSATTKINRKDWNLNWNVALETGGFLVGDEIKIDIEAEIIKQA